jgi:GNAT superfamily N-acetyltransferase
MSAIRSLAPNTQRVTLHRFAPTSVSEIEELVELCYDYFAEQFDRTGVLAPGIAVAGFLDTYVLALEEETVGFISVDPRRRSVELIYVAPPFRRQGVATAAVDHLRQLEPAQPMAAKGPLSPAGHLLAQRLDMPVAHSTAEQAARYESGLPKIAAAIRKKCRHTSTGGSPRCPCKRCYRKYLHRTVQIMIATYVLSSRFQARSGDADGAEC